eukprot:TRINITY_DN998_c0_g1_i4.p1 TRINITY_DN998_c0_g1~~TRINITY_DN998_c0_g1_i4.p1  ORF type:complete len:254 (+),score=39.06 TRINITY_DN998_c0_g1_i4:1-762(+)
MENVLKHGYYVLSITNRSTIRERFKANINLLNDHFVIKESYTGLPTAVKPNEPLHVDVPPSSQLCFVFRIEDKETGSLSTLPQERSYHEVTYSSLDGDLGPSVDPYPTAALQNTFVDRRVFRKSLKVDFDPETIDNKVLKRLIYKMGQYTSRTWNGEDSGVYFYTYHDDRAYYLLLDNKSEDNVIEEIVVLHMRNLILTNLAAESAMEFDKNGSNLINLTVEPGKYVILNFKVSNPREPYTCLLYTSPSPRDS